MGCDPAHNGGYECHSDELPLHPVYLSAYQIDKTEVTNVQYARWISEVSENFGSPPANRQGSSLLMHLRGCSGQMWKAGCFCGIADTTKIPRFSHLA
jgi:formylglycine-generating enzyme required for sulfatase activity